MLGGLFFLCKWNSIIINHSLRDCYCCWACWAGFFYEILYTSSMKDIYRPLSFHLTHHVQKWVTVIEVQLSRVNPYHSPYVCLRERQWNVWVETRTFTISLLFHSLSLLDSSIREHFFFTYLFNLHPPSVFNYEPCQYFRIMSIRPYYLNPLRYHITWTHQHSFFASANPTYFHNQFFSPEQLTQMESIPL